MTSSTVNLPSTSSGRRLLRWLEGRIPEALGWPLLVWSVSRLSLTALGVLMWRLFPSVTHPPADSYFGVAPWVEGWRGALLGVWQRWDAIHYLRIASSGYSEEALTAFSPLFPLLGRFVSQGLGLKPLTGLLLVSNVSTLLAFITLYQISADAYNQALARMVVVAIAVYPGAFYLFAPYAEAVTLALVLLAYLAASRHQWFASAIAAIAAGLTHVMAVPLSAALAGLGWQQSRGGSRLRAVPFALVAAGPALGQGVFLAWRASAGLPSLVETHAEFWGVAFRPLWVTLLQAPLALISSRPPQIAWADLAVVIISLGLGVWAIRRLPLPLVLCHWAAVLLLLATDSQTEPLVSWVRHGLMIPSLFVAASLWADTPARRRWAFALAFGTQVYLAGHFFMWSWTG